MRTLLFVPGIDERKLAKVGTFGADLICIDLEDAVADSEKTAARAVTRAAIPTYDDKTVVTVRVNALDTGRLEDDIASVVCSDLDAILVPKIEDTDTLRIADDALARASERDNGVETGSMRILAIIETPLGMVRCEDTCSRRPLASSPRSSASATSPWRLGVDVTHEAHRAALRPLPRHRRRARRGGCVPPLDGPYLEVEDLEGCLVNSCRSRALGFQGRVAVYPPQVGPMQRGVLGPERRGRGRQPARGGRLREGRGRASPRSGSTASSSTTRSTTWRGSGCAATTPSRQRRSRHERQTPLALEGRASRGLRDAVRGAGDRLDARATTAPT